jgi:hypothetical protein
VWHSNPPENLNKRTSSTQVATYPFSTPQRPHRNDLWQGAVAALEQLLAAKQEEHVALEAQRRLTCLKHQAEGA